MDLTANIRREFARAVKNYAASQALPVVFENVSVPQPSGDYLETYLMPTETGSGTLNAARQNGLFQINIYTLQNKGTLTADRIAAELMALFVRGTRLGIVAIGKHPNRSKGMLVNGWYAVTVTVDYFVIE